MDRIWIKSQGKPDSIELTGTSCSGELFLEAHSHNPAQTELSWGKTLDQMVSKERQ